MNSLLPRRLLFSPGFEESGGAGSDDSFELLQDPALSVRRAPRQSKAVDFGVLLAARTLWRFRQELMAVSGDSDLDERDVEAIADALGVLGLIARGVPSSSVAKPVQNGILTSAIDVPKPLTSISRFMRICAVSTTERNKNLAWPLKNSVYFAYRAFCDKEHLRSESNNVFTAQLRDFFGVNRVHRNTASKVGGKSQRPFVYVGFRFSERGQELSDEAMSSSNAKGV